MKRLVLGIGIVLVGAPASAQGYDLWAPFPPPFTQAAIFTTLAPELQPALQGVKNQPASNAPRWVVPKLSPLTASENARLSFKPSLERRKTHLNAMVGRWRAVNPAAANDFQRLIGQADLFKVIADSFQKFGFGVNNVADAYAAYWINAWEAAHGVYTPGSKKQAQGVKLQVARAMLDSGALGQLTDAQKQELAEELLIQVVIIGAANEAVQGNLDQQVALADSVQASARQWGLDLTLMRLTEEGFAFPQ